jgi:hypothetical protein
MTMYELIVFLVMNFCYFMKFLFKKKINVKHMSLPKICCYYKMKKMAKETLLPTLRKKYFLKFVKKYLNMLVSLERIKTFNFHM